MCGVDRWTARLSDAAACVRGARFDGDEPEPDDAPDIWLDAEIDERLED